MASINLMSFSMLFLAIIATLLLVSQNANAADPKPIPGINQFCLTATSKRLCTRMVKGATTHHEATLNAIEVAIEVAKKFEVVKPALEAATDKLNNPEMKSNIIETCDEGFSSTLEDLELSIQSLNKGDKGTVGTRLSASLDSACADSLKERGIQVPTLDKLNGHFAKVMNNVLAVFFQT